MGGRPARPRYDPVVSESGSPLDVRGTPYPPYVSSTEERLRWDQATLVALATSAAHEEAGQADLAFVWHTSRAIYNDPEFATGTAEELASMVDDAVELGFLAREESRS
jgi:hypothetical protein